MRDLLTGLAILVILVLAAATAAPWFVDWNAWRGEVEKHLTTALGRNVRIGGDLSIRLLPQPHLTARKISIEAAQAPAALTIDSLDAELSLTSLLSGELRIVDGTIDRPAVTWRDAPAARPSPGSPTEKQFGSIAIERLAIRGGEFRNIAADGRVLFAAGADLVIETSQLAGPWKAQGRVEFDGKRYDIRWSSGALDADGKAAIKAALQDAGLSFIADIEGSLIIDRAGWRAPPRFEGRLAASGVLPWPFGKTVGPQPWRLTATGGGDANGFEASAVEIEAGPQDIGVKAEGEGMLRFANGLSGKIALKARPIDFDRMLAVDPGQTPQPLPMENAAELERLLAAIPFPVVFDVQVDRAYARADSFGPLRVSGRMEPGTVTLDRAEAQAPGGVKAGATGRIWIDSEPALEATINLAAAAPAKAWQWLSGAPPDILANQRFAKAGSAAASGRVRWRPGRLAFDEGVVTLDGAKAQLDFQRRFATGDDPGRFGLRVRADRLDLDLLPPVDVLPDTVGPDVAVSINAKEVVSATLGASIGSIELDARQQAGVLTLNKLLVSQKGLTVSADGMVKDGIGRFAADVAAEDMKPLAAMLQRAFPGAYTNALAARAAALSPAKFNGSLQPSRDGRRWQARIEGVAGETRFAALADAPRGGDPAAAARLESLRIRADAADSGKLIRQLGWEGGASGRPGSVLLEIDNAPNQPAGFAFNATVAGVAIEASAKAADAVTPTFAGGLRINAADIAPALSLLKLSSAGGAQRGWLESDLELGIAGLRLANLRGDLGGKTVRAGTIQVAIGEQPRMTGDIEIAALSLADVSTLALGVDGTSGAGGFWSAARFPTFAAWPIAFDIDLRAPRFDLGGGWTANDAALRLSSRNDGLRIDNIAGAFADGKISGSATIRRDGVAATMTGRLDATRLDLARLGASGVPGQLDLAFDFSGNGDSLSRMASGLAGAGSMTLRKVSFPQIDAGASARVVASQAKNEAMPSMPLLTPLVEQELSRAPLTLEALSAPVTISNGVARIGPARAESLAALIVGSSQVDLRSWTIDARAQITGRAADGALSPEIGLVYTGPLAMPRRSIEVGDLFSDLTQRAAAREADRVQALEHDARERAAFNRRLRVDRDRTEAERRGVRPPDPAPVAPPPAPPLTIPGLLALPPADAPPAQ